MYHYLIYKFYIIFRRIIILSTKIKKTHQMNLWNPNTEIYKKNLIINYVNRNIIIYNI